MKFLYTLLLVLVSIPLSAQTDVRLSDTNRIVYPPDVTAQQISRIGTRSLVVFGSTATDPVTLDVVRLLRVQLLEGLQPIGAQRNLTDDPASRPLGSFSIAAGTDRFFVAFKDARSDRPGVYLQSIGLDGVNIGPAEFVGEQISVDFPMAMYGFIGSPSEGYLIVWSERLSSSQHATYGRRIDTQGRTVGPEMLLATAYIDASITVASLPGLSILSFASPVDTARLVNAAGHFDPRPIPSARLGGAYFISADTSIASIEGSSLKIYGKIFDATPLQTIPLPAIAGIRPETWTVTRDAGSNLLQLHYLRVVDTIAGLRYAIERITLTQTGFPAPELLVDSTLKRDTVAGMTYSGVSIGSGFRQRLCLQRYRISGFALYRTVLPTGIDQRTEPIGFGVDEEGRFQKGDSIWMRPCDPTADYSVARLQNDSISRIVVRIGADSTTLENRRTKITVVTPERLPNIFERAGRILTTWSKSADSATWLLQNYDGTLADTPTMFARYEAPGRGIRIPGAQLLVMQTFDRPSETTYRARFRLQLASLALWRVAQSIDQVAFAPTAFRVEDASYDPNNKQIFALISRLGDTAGPQTSIFIIDSNGTTLGSMFSLPIPATSKLAVIPAGDRGYIIVSNNSATRFDRETTIGTFSFASSWPDARYQGLRGDRFLRWQMTGARDNPEQIEMEIYNLGGTLLHSRTFTPRVGLLTDPFIAENPTDGSLAILHSGATTGIRVVYQDSAFASEPIYAQISATTGGAVNPAGVWLRDTLQVVWEDMRNGEPDIYGTWWSPSRVSSVKAPVSTPYQLDLTDVPPEAYNVIARNAAGIVATRLFVQ